MKRHEEHKDKKKKLILSIFIVAIMTLSALGYMVDRYTPDQTKYNDFKFFAVNNNQWATKINGQEIAFNYLPPQVETINISSSIIEKIKNAVQIDTTSDPNSTFKEAIALAQFELANSLNINNQFLRIGFTQENDFNLPVITCENATNIILVLLFEKSNETIVYEQNNCIILKAKSAYDFIALKDRILYGVFGIIN